ncbi:MAG: hypothetical protein R3F34_03260 [Planctomycetota bacterium]
MRTTAALAVTALLTFSLALQSCGEPPRTAPKGSGGTGAVQSPSPNTNASTPSTGAQAQGEALRYAGEVVLSGAIADAQGQAAVFVSLKPRDPAMARMPILSKRIALTDVGAQRGADGELRIPFVLTGSDSMAGGPALTSAQLPGDVDVEAMFSAEGGLTNSATFPRARVGVEGANVEGVRLELTGN